jgi:hypothetical protein
MLQLVASLARPAARRARACALSTSATSSSPPPLPADPASGGGGGGASGGGGGEAPDGDGGERGSGSVFSGTGVFPEYEGEGSEGTGHRRITKVAAWSVGTSGGMGAGPVDPSAPPAPSGGGGGGGGGGAPAVMEMDAALLAAMEAAGPLMKTAVQRQPLMGYEQTALFHRERLSAERREMLKPGARPGERVLPTQRMSFVESAFEVIPGKLNPAQMTELFELVRAQPALAADAAALAARYDVDEALLASMLQVNRTARLSGDPTQEEAVYGSWD